MSASEQSLAIGLVNELERLGAQFSFFLDDNDEIAFAWVCQGIAKFRRCKAILSLALVDTEFGEAFRDELEDRYLQGRMRAFAGAA